MTTTQHSIPKKPHEREDPKVMRLGEYIKSPRYLEVEVQPSAGREAADMAVKLKSVHRGLCITWIV